MKGFFKYKTLEDLYLHASDEMSGFAKEAADTNFHKENFYAAGLLFCSPDWQEVRENQGENLNIKNKYDKKEIKRNICILPKIPSSEDILWMNNYLHLVHLENKEIREQSIRLIDKNSVTINFENWHGANGHSGFPDVLKEQIEKVLKPFRDDISIKYGCTWVYSHFDSENIYIVVNSINKEILNSVKQQIENKIIIGDVSLEDLNIIVNSDYADKANEIITQVQNNINDKKYDAIIKMIEDEIIINDYQFLSGHMDILTFCEESLAEIKGVTIEQIRLDDELIKFEINTLDEVDAEYIRDELVDAINEKDIEKIQNLIIEDNKEDKIGIIINDDIKELIESLKEELEIKENFNSKDIFISEEDFRDKLISEFKDLWQIENDKSIEIANKICAEIQNNITNTEEQQLFYYKFSSALALPQLGRDIDLYDDEDKSIILYKDLNNLLYSYYLTSAALYEENDISFDNIYETVHNSAIDSKDDLNNIIDNINELIDNIFEDSVLSEDFNNMYNTIVEKRIKEMSTAEIITIPEYVSKINNTIFDSCDHPNLKKVIFDGSINAISDISVFDYCPDDLQIEFDYNNEHIEVSIDEFENTINCIDKECFKQEEEIETEEFDVTD